MASRRKVGKKLKTYFASPERSVPEALREQAAAAKDSPAVQALLHAVDANVLVVNENREIVAASEPLMAELRLGPDEVVGQRVGEVLGCVHAPEGPSGCGTSPSCADCGALGALLESRRAGVASDQEVVLTLRRGEILDATEFRVRATPLRVGHHELTAMLLRDVSAERRREALERVLFHDVLDTISGLVDYSEELAKKGEPSAEAAVSHVRHLVDRLAREVKDQRTLVEAERGELDIRRTAVEPEEILESVRVIAASDAETRGRRFTIVEPVPGPMTTDSTLLVRIVAGMVRNALEAVPDGGRLQLEYERRGDRAIFAVWNEGVIPKEVQRRIFERSFTTKGTAGRGLGTYGMRLLGERWLGGKVGFTSSEHDGTRFFIELPADSIDG